MNFLANSFSPTSKLLNFVQISLHFEIYCVTRVVGTNRLSVDFNFLFITNCAELLRATVHDVEC